MTSERPKESDLVCLHIAWQNCNRKYKRSYCWIRDFSGYADVLSVKSLVQQSIFKLTSKKDLYSEYLHHLGEKMLRNCKSSILSLESSVVCVCCDITGDKIPNYFLQIRWLCQTTWECYSVWHVAISVFGKILMSCCSETCRLHANNPSARLGSC